jgi:hypothetical protein
MTRGITVGTTLEAMVEAQGGKYDDKLKLQGQVVGWGIEWLQVGQIRRATHNAHPNVLTHGSGGDC